MLSIELICDRCENELTIEATTDTLEYFRVKPCATCLRDEYDEGYDTGYEQGHEEGYDEGYDEGLEDCE